MYELYLMTLKPLNVLKKGLSKITQGLKVHRDELNAKLAHKESISSSDKYWQIEALLGSFTRQLHLEETRHMKNAALTDFFK